MDLSIWNKNNIIYWTINNILIGRNMHNFTHKMRFCTVTVWRLAFLHKRNFWNCDMEKFTIHSESQLSFSFDQSIPTYTHDCVNQYSRRVQNWVHCFATNNKWRSNFFVRFNQLIDFISFASINIFIISLLAVSLTLYKLIVSKYFDAKIIIDTHRNMTANWTNCYSK